MSVYKTVIESQVASTAISMSQSFPSGGAALVTQAITTSATDVYAVVIDNSLNTSASYLKCYDSAVAAGIGADHPDMLLKADAGATVQYSIDSGAPFSNGIAAAVLTSKGTAGTTAPSNDVNVTFLATPT